MKMSDIDPHSPLPTPNSLLPIPLQHPAVHRLLLLALAEDLNESADPDLLFPDPSQGDITSQATLPPASTLEGRITAKAEGVIAGLPLAQDVFYLVDPSITFQPSVQDGAHVQPGTLLAEVSGPGASLLTAERTALNFLGRMSGIATLTHKFVQAVAGTKAVILDTRKTVPGLRHIDKYAVRMGGGQNHRAGLYDMVLIKDNHIDGADGIRPAVEGVRSRYGSRYLVEVEVKDLAELRTALALPVDRIMLDNMDLDTMRQAVELAAGRVPLEASGNVTLATVRSIAETGVDFISSGALTHSAPVLDISMRLR
jgi:nicotinate-nucleotide pyrophosphorylase (carboxylating)